MKLLKTKLPKEEIIIDQKNEGKLVCLHVMSKNGNSHAHASERAHAFLYSNYLKFQR